MKEWLREEVPVQRGQLAGIAMYGVGVLVWPWPTLSGALLILGTVMAWRRWR